MLRGAFTGYVDVAQVALYVFWAFFAGLIFYLRREDHREGYPLVTEVPGEPGMAVPREFPPTPRSKVFRLFHGGVALSPTVGEVQRPIAGVPAGRFPGAPLQPIGDPMLAGIGPGSWVQREDEPDLTIDGANKFKPLRIALEYRVDPHVSQPQGMRVIGADGVEAGTVVDVWIDEIAHEIVFLEMELDAAATPSRTMVAEDAEPLRRVLVPQPMLRFRPRRRQVSVRTLLAHQFVDVPRLRDPDRITRLEEERILAYYGGGYLYATPARLGPLL